MSTATRLIRQLSLITLVTTLWGVTLLWGVTVHPTPATAEGEQPAPTEDRPTWEEEEAYDAMGADFSPTWDEDEDWDGDDNPQAAEGGDDEGNGEDEPEADDLDEDGLGLELAPAWEDDELGDDFAPVWDDDDELGDDFAPVWDDDDEDPAAATVDEDPWDDDDYEAFWEQFDAEEAATQAVSETLEEGLGRVEGRVIEAEFREGMAEVVIEVEGQDRLVRTQSDGRFAFDLAPGVYVLRLRSPGYQPQAYEVEVESGISQDIGVLRMEVDRAATTTIVVEGRARRDGAATLLLQRREAAAVSDGISGEEISRSPDSSASDSVRRVVAATIVDGQYLFVRGLGGRYTQVLLNGAPVPSTDPDYPGVQLDLFPASLLAGITIFKTATPDLPGDFTGGLMWIESRDYPEDFTLTLELGTTYELGGTFTRAPDHRGGSLEWLGWDDGTRGLPSAVPARRRLSPGRGGMTNEEAYRIAGAFQNRWDVQERLVLPGLRLTLNVGDTLEAGGRPFGYALTLGYSLSQDTDEAVVRLPRLQGEEGSQVLTSRGEFDELRGTSSANLSGLLTLSWDVAPRSTLRSVSLVRQSGQESTRIVSGFSDAEAAEIEQRSLRWVERTLAFQQFAGHHRGLGWDGELRWNLTGSLALRREPDTRDLTLIEGPDGFLWRNAPGSGERLFTELQQWDLSSGADWLSRWTERFHTRVGASARYVDRGFMARRFRYNYVGQSAADRYLDPEVLFAPESLGGRVELNEQTGPTDGFSAEQLGVSSFALVDLRFRAPLRLTTGARLEFFEQSIGAETPFRGERAQGSQDVSRQDLDLLPSAALTWSLTDNANLRLAYGQTVARPQLRELAPFRYQDYVRRRSAQGNPGLERTLVHNLDLRWELFPSRTEVVALSLFGKFFEQPIEQVILDRNGNISYDNIDNATNVGGEAEVRVSGATLHEGLRAFSLGANLTLVYSRVQLSAEQQRNSTSAERPLAGQSPWVANANLEFAPPGTGLSVGLFYNVFGRRIEEVGRLGLPDVYLQPMHLVDLSAIWAMSDTWRWKFTVRNVLAQARVERQGPLDTYTQREGVSFSLSLRYAH